MTNSLFDLSGRSALVTGGTGTLGRAIAFGLAGLGARVAILSRDSRKGSATAEQLRGSGAESINLTADVLRRESLEAVRSQLLDAWGCLDILVNAAGGNLPAAVLPAAGSFIDLDVEAFRQVVDLNLLGALIPSKVFAPTMLAGGHGSIINISSLAADRPLTRVAGYGAGKAALENLTRWMAVNLAQQHSSALRVNAIVPGFFMAEQNRGLLVSEEGLPTARGRAVIANTPMGRFGDPDDLVGAVGWLASDASRFVTGVLIPIDGGFSAYAGV